MILKKIERKHDYRKGIVQMWIGIFHATYGLFTIYHIAIEFHFKHKKYKDFQKDIFVLMKRYIHI